MQKLSTLVVGLCLLGSASAFAHTKIVTHQGDHMHQGKMSNHSNPNGMTDCEIAIINKAKADKETKEKIDKMIHAFKDNKSKIDC